MPLQAVPATQQEETEGLAAGMAAPARPAASVPAQPNVPALGTFTPAKSKYYNGQVVDPVSGTHYDAATGQATAAPLSTQKSPAKSAAASSGADIVLNWDEPPAGSLIGRYAGVFAALLVLGALIARAIPASYVVPLLVINFLGGMLLPILRVAPWQDEDADDVLMFVILTFVFGPAISLVVYGVIGLLRQNANPAIVGCMAVSLLSRLTLDLAVGKFQLAQMTPWQFNNFQLGALLINWAGLVALAGWYMANIFHKLHE